MIGRGICNVRIIFLVVFWLNIRVCRYFCLMSGGVIIDDGNC